MPERVASTPKRNSPAGDNNSSTCSGNCPSRGRKCSTRDGNAPSPDEKYPVCARSCSLSTLDDSTRDSRTPASRVSDSMTDRGCPEPDRSDPTPAAKDRRRIARGQRAMCAIRDTAEANQCPIAPCRRRVLAPRGAMHGMRCPIRAAQRRLFTSRRQQSGARRRSGAIRRAMLSLRRALQVCTRRLDEARRARRALLRLVDTLRGVMEVVRRQASTNGRRFIVENRCNGLHGTVVSAPEDARVSRTVDGSSTPARMVLMSPTEAQPRNAAHAPSSTDTLVLDVRQDALMRPTPLRRSQARPVGDDSHVAR